MKQVGRRDDVVRALRALRPDLERRGVRHAALFGSIARGDDVLESDVDIIVDLDPSSDVGIFAFDELRSYLEARLGMAVDLGTRGSLQAGRHDEILRDLVTVF